MRIGLLEPNSLVGKELRELITARDETRFEVELLTATVDELGTLTEVDDEAALVAGLTEEVGRALDIAVLCGTAAEQHRALAMIPDDGPQVVIAATELEHPDGEIYVAGLEEARPGPDTVLLSPYPATIALAHLLAPLLEVGLRRAAATVLLPASSFGAAGLDELFGQARSLLNFQSEKPAAVFGYQLAFNFLPGPSSDRIAADVTEALHTDPNLTLQLVQSPVFHGIAVSLLVELEEELEEAAVARHLCRSPFVDAFEPTEGLGPIDSTQRDEILLGRVRADPSAPGSYWLWAVMDNLRRGGASNVLALLDELAAERAVN